MTIVLGFKCEDGIVLAADSQCTLGRTYKLAANKIVKLTARSNVRGIISGAGPTFYIKMAEDDIDNGLGKARTPQQAKRAITDALQKLYTEHIRPSCQDTREKPGPRLLIGLWFDKAG